MSNTKILPAHQPRVSGASAPEHLSGEELLAVGAVALLSLVAAVFFAKVAIDADFTATASSAAAVCLLFMLSGLCVTALGIAVHAALTMPSEQR